MRIAAPPQIRPEWIKGGPARTIMDTSGTNLVTYDPFTRCGGVYRVEAGVWTIVGPLTLPEFATALQALRCTLPDVHDLQLWLDAVGPDVSTETLQ